VLVLGGIVTVAALAAATGQLDLGGVGVATGPLVPADTTATDRNRVTAAVSVGSHVTTTVRDLALVTTTGGAR